MWWHFELTVDLTDSSVNMRAEREREREAGGVDGGSQNKLVQLDVYLMPSQAGAKKSLVKFYI